MSESAYIPSPKEIEAVAECIWESLLARPSVRSWDTEMDMIQEIYCGHAVVAIQAFMRVHDNG